MVSGPDLLGATIEPRRRGRPKGSTNKRAKDLKGFIDSRYGASAAQQSAAVCMVTPAELKRAGGSMAKAQVAKAMDLVNHVREAQAEADTSLRRIVREELADLAATLGDYETAAQLRAAVNKFIDRVKEGSAGFGLVAAMKMLADERAALLPYTDQRQPLAVDVTGVGGQPSVVIMGAAPAMASLGAEKTEVFDGVFTEVSQLKSHADGEGLEIPGLLPAPATD